MIDWSFAMKIAAGGFGLVFMLLTLLAVVIWLSKEVIERLFTHGRAPH